MRGSLVGGNTSGKPQAWRQVGLSRARLGVKGHMYRLQKGVGEGGMERARAFWKKREGGLIEEVGGDRKIGGGGWGGKVVLKGWRWRCSRPLADLQTLFQINL